MAIWRQNGFEFVKKDLKYVDFWPLSIRIFLRMDSFKKVDKKLCHLWFHSWHFCVWNIHHSGCSKFWSEILGSFWETMAKHFNIGRAACFDLSKFSRNQNNSKVWKISKFLKVFDIDVDQTKFENDESNKKWTNSETEKTAWRDWRAWSYSKSTGQKDRQTVEKGRKGKQMSLHKSDLNSETFNNMYTIFTQVMHLEGPSKLGFQDVWEMF